MNTTNGLNKYAPIIDNQYIQGSLVKYKNSLYNLGFTFALGSIKSDINYIIEMYLFNANTINTYDCFRAYNNGFHDDTINKLKELIIKEIEDRSFFAKAYIMISSSGNTYKIGYNSIMDSNTYAGTNMNFDIFSFGYNSSVIAAADYQENPYKYYKDTNLTLLNPSYFNTTELNNNFKNNITQWTFDTIKNITKGISVNSEGKRYLILDLSQ